jgi:hypothetical protein
MTTPVTPPTSGAGAAPLNYVQPGITTTQLEEQEIEQQELNLTIQQNQQAQANLQTQQAQDAQKVQAVDASSQNIQAVNAAAQIAPAAQTPNVSAQAGRRNLLRVNEKI